MIRDAEFVIYRLEEAGATLLALPPTGYSQQVRSCMPDVVRSAEEISDAMPPGFRPARPDRIKITRMDEAYGWVGLIPDERMVLRRIVGVRSLVSPVTERHLYSWRRVGVILGADHHAVQRWHQEGIDIIVRTLNGADPAQKSKKGRCA